MSNLLLIRRWFTERSTIGELYVDRVFECYVLEDVSRPKGSAKVPGRTAIPEGEYQVVVTRSPRFKRDMPLLLDVPGFKGIRIHPGNSDKDTEGCLLPGLVRGVDRVLESRQAYDALFKVLSVPGPHAIEIREER